MKLSSTIYLNLIFKLIHLLKNYHTLFLKIKNCNKHLISFDIKVLKTKLL